MAAKITSADLIAAGWRKDQLTAASTDGEFSTYLQAVADDAGAWVEAKLGATAYADASGYALVAIKRAEQCRASAELWRRVGIYFDSRATSNTAFPNAREREDYRKAAEESMRCANEALADAAITLGVDLPDDISGSAMAVGYIETGQFSQTSTGALNG